MVLRRLSLTGILCGAVLLGACGARYDWSHASTVNTIPAYQTFLSKYPNDPHVVDARRRIARLQDDRAWTTAQIASSVPGYQRYLRTEPNGSHAPMARDEVVTRERALAWQSVQTHETVQSLRDFLKRYPSGPEADEAHGRLKTMAGYRAEFASARSERFADHDRDVLTKRFGKELPQVVVLEPDKNDRDYRVTSSPMSEREASAACETFRHSGRPCEVVEAAS